MVMVMVMMVIHTTLLPIIPYESTFRSSGVRRIDIGVGLGVTVGVGGGYVVDCRDGGVYGPNFCTFLD